MHGKYKDPWSATQNGTYFAAAYFFYRERKLGKHALGKTRAHKASASGAGAAAADTAASTSTKKLPLPDTAGVSTDGMTYLTPAEVRKELRAALQKYDASVATLARAASMPYQSFNNFMKASGDFGGRDNQCYHPAADLVERLRLATGKAKSKKRKALEAEVDAGIVDSRSGGPKLGLDPHGKYWMPVGAPFRMTKDSLGRNASSPERGVRRERRRETLACGRPGRTRHRESRLTHVCTPCVYCLRAMGSALLDAPPLSS